jgi:hypothetical protein
VIDILDGETELVLVMLGIAAIFGSAIGSTRCSLTPSSSKKGMTRSFKRSAAVMRHYWATACSACPLKEHCTTARKRRIKRWEHEAVLEAAQDRLDRRPDAMTEKRSTAEHPFGTIKFWMGVAHFLTKRLGNVRTEMALHVLSYNMKRAMIYPWLAWIASAMRVWTQKTGTRCSHGPVMPRRGLSSLTILVNQCPSSANSSLNGNLRHRPLLRQ